MRKKYMLYISDQLYQTVKDSQVINWLEVLGRKQVVFDLFREGRLCQDQSPREDSQGAGPSWE